MVAGSDGTVVSVATGQNEYHPVYLSIGNVHNQTRRARRGALILIGFLAIPKSNPVSCLRQSSSADTFCSGSSGSGHCAISKLQETAFPYFA